MVDITIGRRPDTGTSFVKVLKYSTDDPFTLANTAYDRYYFNSETANLSYVFGFFQTPAVLNKSNYPGGFSPGSNYGLQTGSLGDQWVMRSTYATSGQNAGQERYEIFGCIGRMPDLQNTIPFAEVKLIAPNGAARILWNFKPDTSSAYYFSVTNYGVITYSFETAATGLQYRRIPAAMGYTGWCIRPSNSSAGFTTELQGNQDFVSTMMWDLPCNNVPIPKPVATPVAGQEMMRLQGEGANAVFVLTQPGFSVGGSSGRQRIIDSTRTPIKVVMMGETPAIAPGNSYFVAKPASIDFDLSPTMVCDTICSLNGWGFAIPPVNLNTGFTREETFADYVVEPGGIRFYVRGTHSVAVRFMLYATGLGGLTSGGSQIIRRLGNEHIQIKRPGSSDVAPGFNDILLDTRFSAVTVIADGYVPASSFTASQQVHWRYGNVGYRINFNPNGMFIFPKIIADFGDMYRQGNHAMYLSPGGGVEVLRQSLSTVVGADYCIPHLSPGNSAGTPEPAGFPQPQGVRYYILGVSSL